MYVKTSYNFHSVARDFKQTISTVQSRISIKNRNIHENSRKMHHHQNQVRSFLRQIAISLELLVLFFCASNRTYRHPRRARKAHTHTHVDSFAHGFLPRFARVPRARPPVHTCQTILP